MNIPVANSTSIPKFSAFNPTEEPWKDCLAHFHTFVVANSITMDKQPKVFLTNLMSMTYKLLSNLASQQQPPQEVNDLSMDEIKEFMKSQFDPTLFVVRERFKFWSEMQRKPGETIQELAARIRHDAATCNFAAIKDPQDEALRTRFMCSVNNEAVLKTLFKMKDEELTFTKAISVAIETEDAAKVAKETTFGTKGNEVKQVQQMSKKPQDGTKTLKKSDKEEKAVCFRCGKKGHLATKCKFKETECHFCHKKGHLQAVCNSKKRSEARGQLKVITQRLNTVKIQKQVRQLIQPIELKGQKFNFEVDTGAGDNFCSIEVWEKLGKPELTTVEVVYEVANKQPLPVLGFFKVDAKIHQQQGAICQPLNFNVTKVRSLNLLGREGIQKMAVDLNSLISGGSSPAREVHAVFDHLPVDNTLQRACRQLCDEFSDIFKPELGCLKDLELDITFKSDAKPIFCKPRPVPLAIQKDLNRALDVGIRKGVWEPTCFSEYGTPVVPIRKAALPGQTKANIRVCGDYSVTVNPQLEDHRQVLPLPEDLMRKLGGGHGFTKIDLADAYNQVKLTPESQKKLALSTHRGVLLQKRLPFGIKSAPGYFQEIMEQLTSDLRGVAVYLDDILVSGTTAQEHLENLRALLKRLSKKGLRCRLEKCSFAQPVVEYLGHTLSSEGIAKGPKVDAIKQMPPPTDVSSLSSFLGSVQFYSKFLPNLSTVLEPLNKLRRKGEPWHWGDQQQNAFDTLKTMLGEDTVLVHYDPSLKIGISCDASSAGVGAVLFHRYPNGSERPIANVSKTLTDAQRRYSQIQKEALAIVYGLKKFHQFLYGRKFILVTDHKPLQALFGPTKPIPLMAANRLARWALMLSQYSGYTIEYRKTKEHGNADALSRLPAGPDDEFDGEEGSDDADVVCTIRMISQQMKPLDADLVKKETAKDPVLTNVMRYVREGWPPQNKLSEDTSHGCSIKDFYKAAESLSVVNGCLLYGSRVVIPQSLQQQVLQLLHIGHCGIQ